MIKENFFTKLNIKTKLFLALQLVLAPAQALADDLDVFDVLENDSTPLVKSSKSSRKSSDLSAGVDFSQSYKYGYKKNEQTPLEDQSVSGQSISRVRLDFDYTYRKSDFIILNLGLGAEGLYESSAFSSDKEGADSTLKNETFFIDESFIVLSPQRNIDLSFGRMILGWGKSNTLRVNDFINPMDRRQFGILDIEDMKLPVGLAKLDFSYENFSLSAVSMFEKRFDMNPKVGSDYYPSRFPMMDEEAPKNNLKNTEFALKASAYFSNFDLSAYYGSYYDDNPYLENTDSITLGQNLVIPTNYTLKHALIDHAGLSASYNLENFTFYSDLALLDGLPRYGTNDFKRRLDTLAGLEYNDGASFYISAEYVKRSYDKKDIDLPREINNFTPSDEDFSLTVKKSYLREKLNLELAWLTFGKKAKDGSLLRLSSSYSIDDNTSVYGKIIDYANGNKTSFENIDNNDQVVVGFHHSI